MRSAICLSSFFLIAFITVNSCKEEPPGNPSEMIINSWKLKDFEPAKHLTMPDSVKQVIIDRTVIEYKADGTFIQTGMGKPHNGTYRVSSDGKYIRYVMDKTNYTFTDTIISFTRNKLKVVDQNGNRMTRVVK